MSLVVKEEWDELLERIVFCQVYSIPLFVVRATPVKLKIWREGYCGWCRGYHSSLDLCIDSIGFLSLMT